MGLVAVGKYQRTKTPFFVEQAGLNLYSLEELSYFLYHNICLADRRLFDERLSRWLREEFGCTKLAEQIEKRKTSGAGIQDLVLPVVEAGGFFSGQEIAELRERLKGLAKLQEQERLKLRADEEFELIEVDGTTIGDMESGRE